MRPSSLVFALLMVFVPGLAFPQDAQPLTLETAPPVVTKTVPIAGSGNIDPGLAEIRVTFSKGMVDNSWSWIQHTPATFPPIVGDPQFLKDGRTCVIQVQLKPDHTYVVGMNSQRFSNFKDTAGRAALPYLLVFRTGKPR